MIPFVIGWLAGLWLLQQWPGWAPWGALAAAGSILVAWRLSAAAKWRAVPLGVLAGLLWGALWAQQHRPVPERWLDRPLDVQLVVDGLSEHRQAPYPRQQVRARIEQVRRVGASTWQSVDWAVRLRLYGEQAMRVTLEPGSRWQMRVRLSPVHGWINEAGFDYERWAWSRGVQALARGLDAHPQALGTVWHPDQLRDAFRRQVAALWRHSPYAGFYDALTFGDRSRIAPEQWRLLRETGTSHLMAISGLHMGLVAALGYGLFYWVWRWLPFLWTRMVRPRFAVLGMVGVATLYLLLSGAAIPAQRAWLMVVLVAVLLWCRRFWHPWGLLALAALLITLWHPPSVLAAGFWLSFGAVAIIFALLVRWGKQPPSQWKQLLVIQAALLIGLVPLSLALFGESAAVASWVNLLLVPLLPLMLIGLVGLSVLAWLLPALGEKLVALTDGLWYGMVELLQWAADHAGLLAGSLPLWLAVLWTLAWALFLAHPRCWRPVALLSVALAVSLGWHGRPAPGTAQVHVLDVGQGQAVVVETAHHVLLYDAGPRWGRLDAGETVVAVLRHRGWRQLDRLIVSHSDRDHAGGVGTIRREMSVVDYVSGQPGRLPGSRACRNGQQWMWDGVRFAIFRLPDARTDNDASCILWLGTGEAGMLLTGDLSVRGERWLLDQLGRDHPAQWMLAGHHGSATSNGSVLLDGLGIRQVAVSAGYRNPFHLPAAAVKARWLKRGITVHCTGCAGQLTWLLSHQGVRLTGQGRAQSPTIYRHECVHK